MNLIRIPIVFLIGLSIGGTILISQYYGASNLLGKEEQLILLLPFHLLQDF